ncbi:BA14K family protein [Roseibium sp. MMSF_3544]|uniref:BA14K family protein n=1 Tax=unclassified Roseibium TaxID=2629323 RepID=UPI00273DACCD|nr:BA14K family protein [Roseibium sp. MMSF_3544]
MKTLSKRLLAVALSGALIVPTIATAEAGPRHGWKGQQHHHHHHHYNHKRYKKNNNAGAAVAAGVIGLAAGAILLGAANQPRYAGPPPVNYYPPAPYPPAHYPAAPYQPAPYPGQVSGPGGYQPYAPGCSIYHLNGTCADRY